MAERGVMLTREGARRTAETNRRVLGEIPGAEKISRRKPPLPTTGLVDVSLTSNVTAATPNGKTGPTTFTCKIWSPDPTDTHDPKYCIEATDSVIGVNTSNRTATSGQHAVCAYMNGRLQFLFADCVP